MTKSYSRDVQVLLKMLDNVDNTRSVIKRYNVSFNSATDNALYKNADAFNLCSFFLAQFGEKVKLLTDSSRDDLSLVVDLKVLKYFRNIISHDYESVNKMILQGYIQSLVSSNFRTAIVKRIEFCKENKRQ